MALSTTAVMRVVFLFVLVSCGLASNNTTVAPTTVPPTTAGPTVTVTNTTTAAPGSSGSGVASGAEHACEHAGRALFASLLLSMQLLRSS